MKVFIVRLFLILLFVHGYISDDGCMFSQIAMGFFTSFTVYMFVGLICGMIDEDGEFLFPWVAGILNVLLIFDVYILLFLK